MTTRKRRGFGKIRKLPSGRWQASYQGPDGIRHTARTPEGGPMTFTAKADAEGWLALQQADILRHAWRPPAQPVPAPLTLAAYAKPWLAGRDLGDRARGDYGQILRQHILPAFGNLPIGSITPAAVRA